jgi:ribonuclease HepT-like protein
MSPDAKASTATLARLLAEITADREALVKRLEDAREGERRLRATPTDAGALALAALSLHAWYTGLETIFERVARELDESVPTGDRWHRALLSQMTAEIPGVRPLILEPALAIDLAALLAFRHFFRHAYAVAFDAERLKADLARLFLVSGPVDAALDALSTFLREAMAEIVKE